MPVQDLSSHSSVCTNVKCVLLVSRLVLVLEAGSKAAISQRQQRHSASAVKCALITVFVLKMMLIKWLHCGNTQDI